MEKVKNAKVGEPYYEKLGKKLKELRKKNKLTQVELGELVGKCESTIRKYEAGDVSIPLDTIVLINSVLGVDLLNSTISLPKIEKTREDLQEELEKTCKQLIKTQKELIELQKRVIDQIIQEERLRDEN